MNVCNCRGHGGKRTQQKKAVQGGPGLRVAAFLLCLAMLAGSLPAWAAAADGAPKLSDMVNFQSVALHYAGADGKPAGPEIPDNTKLKKDDALVLRYTYEITAEQCGGIKADTPYYLDVSPHLVLPHLEDGSPLTVEGETEPFGRIYADGSKAWVTFFAKPGGTDTILSDYGGLQDADFYLDCRRADDVPAGESPIDGMSNLYAMKFEDVGVLRFGYAENEPLVSKAQIGKSGSLRDKTITARCEESPETLENQWV